jgi:hypothetical protein
MSITNLKIVMQIFYHVRGIRSSVHFQDFRGLLFLATYIVGYFLDDHSQVVLTEIDQEPDSGYINANYVDVSFIKSLHYSLISPTFV